MQGRCFARSPKARIFVVIPGMEFDSTIHRWHTCKGTARQNSTNPCSEYLFLDNTACNLASLNLMKFKREDGTFDVERFEAAVRIFITAQEILVDNASYPTKEIAENSHIFRSPGPRIRKPRRFGYELRAWL